MELLGRKSRAVNAVLADAGAYVKKPYEMETIGLAIRDELNRQD